MKNTIPLVVGVAGFALLALSSRRASASVTSTSPLGLTKEKSQMLAELNPATPRPKDRGAPFAPIPDHARFWPVPTQKRTVNYVSETEGFKGYAAGNVFGAPRGASASCTNGRKHCGIDLRGKWDDVLVAIGNGKIVGKQGWSGANAKAI